MVPVSENFRLRRKFDECAFIFPHAPGISITVNMGMRMPGWFDIVCLPLRKPCVNGCGYLAKQLMRKTSFQDIEHKEDDAGIMKSVELLHKVVEEQIAKGVASERIIVGGFSQGGAIALLVTAHPLPPYLRLADGEKQDGISCPHKLGGIVALSTWLACAKNAGSLATDANKDTPIFMVHGQIDNVIRHEWAEKSKDVLVNDHGKNIEWHSYPNLDHSADPQEINHLQMWLEKRIPPLGMWPRREWSWGELY